MRHLAAAALIALAVFTACNGGSSAPTSTPSPSATPTPAPTATPTPSPGPHGSSARIDDTFDPERAFAHMQALAVDIGSRPASSEAEREAARYLRDQLRGYGYSVELQPFSYDTFADAGSGLDVLSPVQFSPAVHPFNPSANGAVESNLVAAGMGEVDDFPEETAGNIVLMRRGGLLFSQKVANAEAAGAIAAVIYNTNPGLFAGELQEPSGIPVLGLSQEDGEALLDMAKVGPVRVRLEVKTKDGDQRSQNVVARPPDGQCRLIAGGHYDSVPAGPGANDNASGTATVLEIARVLAADNQFDDVCFMLFGAEEVGLIGSMKFVESMSATETETLEAMLNFDMVGVGTQWLLAGSADLTDIAAEMAEEQGLQYTVHSSSSAEMASDHASFIGAGSEAIFLHAFSTVVADDPNYHTTEDAARYVDPARMATAGELGLAIIDTLLASR